MHKLHRSLRFITFFSALFIICNSYASDNLPDLGSPGLVIYDQNTEHRLGKAFTQALHNQADLLDDQEILSYIRRIGHHIAAQTYENRNFEFYVIKDPTINAFAGPNGVIGIHTGLILAAESEDELASVIAHEVAHVTQQHLSRRFEYQTNTSMATFAAFLAAILVGSQDPSAGMATLLGATGLSIQQQLKHSRIHEHEADHQGIKLLYSAGYDPNAMGSFFGKLARQYQNQDIRPPEILMTHPVTETRLAQAQNRAYQFKNRDPQPSLDFELIQTKTRYLTKTGFSVGKTYSFPQEVSCYQELLRENTKANCLNTALKNNPNNRILASLSADLSFKKNQTDSIEALTKLHNIYPQDASILLNITDKLFDSNEELQAINLLETNSENLKYKYEIYIRISNYYAKLEKMPEASLYLAKAYIEHGNLKRALHHYEQAIKNNNLTNTRLNKELSKLKEILTPDTLSENRTSP